MTTIAINAGHWNHNPKGVPSYMPKLAGTLEFTLNCRVTDKLVELLSEYEVNVLQNFDRNGEMKVGNELDDRIAMAEKAKADFYISIHHNGGINGGTGGGTVVYCYNTTRNRRQATTIYNNIRNHTGLKGNRATPVNYNHTQHKLIEVIKPTMDSMLIECAFMDSRTDIEYIAKPEWPEQVALGILEFLVDEFKLKKKVSAPAPKPVEVTFKIGDVVKLKDGCTYYNGKAIPNWVRKSTLYYRGENKNGLVFSTLKTGAVTGTVKKGDLIKV